MVDYNVQMKKRTDEKWENIFPISKTKNIMDMDRNKTVDDIFSDFENDLLKKGETLEKIAYIVNEKNSTGIQKILNKAKELEKGIRVIIPNGIYEITEPLRVYKNTHIIMDDETILLRKHLNAILINGDHQATYGGYDGHGFITIEGGVLDGNVNEFTNGFNMTMFGRASNITFKHVTFKDVIESHAVDMVSCKDVLFSYCKFIGYRASTDGVYREAIQIGEHTTDGFSEFGTYDSLGCENITIEHCFFGASGTFNTTSYSTGIGQHSAVHDIFHNNIVIKNNVFEGNKYAGIRLYKHNNTRIENNIFSNCLNGIVISTPWTNSYSTQDVYGVQQVIPQAGKNFTVSNNTFEKIGGVGITVDGYGGDGYNAKVENIFIEDNRFLQGTGNAIKITWSSNVFIANNFVKNFGRGFITEYTNDLHFINNIIDDVSWEGIIVQESENEFKNKGYTTNLFINDNILKNPKFTGINIQSVKLFTLKGNHIINPANATDNTRNGITISLSENGTVFDNYVTGTLNKYGIEVTGTASNIQLNNNNVKGKTGVLSLSTTGGNFDGQFIHDTNGNKYKLTISLTGELKATPF